MSIISVRSCHFDYSPPVPKNLARPLCAHWAGGQELTVWRRIFFLILAHSVNKMWIKQESNRLELWNKLHFEEKETESIYRD